MNQIYPERSEGSGAHLRFVRARSFAVFAAQDRVENQ